MIYLILLFTAMPVLELAILIHIGRYIGLWPTIYIVLLTGILGAVLAKMQGLSTLYKIQDNINKGIMPGEEIINGIMILAGGILFLAPGLITDFVGFLMLVPFTRLLLKRLLRKKVEGMIAGGRVITIHSDDFGRRH